MQKILPRFRLSFILQFVVLAFAFAVASCNSPFPRLKMSAEARVTEMRLLIDRYRTEYALTPEKERRWGFKFEEERRKFLQLARTAKDNIEWAQLAFRWVAIFRDAHNSISFTPNTERHGTWIATLGFSAIRVGEELEVTSISPLVDPRYFPLQVGDRITQLEGMSVRDYVQKDVVPYKNLGDDEANFTLLAPLALTKTSIGPAWHADFVKDNVPQERDIRVTLRRDLPGLRERDPASNGQEVKTVTLMWQVSDLFDYKLLSDNQRQQVRETRRGRPAGALERLLLRYDRAFGLPEFPVTILDQYGEPFRPNTAIGVPKRAQNGEVSRLERLMRSFAAPRVPIGVRFDSKAPRADKAEDLVREVNNRSWAALAEARTLPDNYVRIDAAQEYPAVVYWTAERRPIGYLWLHSFSPNTMATDDEIIEQLKSTLRAFERIGVKEVVLDTLNNPGGSVELVLRVAQLFSPKKKIKNFGIQVGVTEDWLQSALRGVEAGPMGQFRTASARILTALDSAQRARSRLTAPLSIELLMPHQLEPDPTLPEFKIAMLINEGNASAGDMIAALMAENKLAELIGKKTMGAGGNVISTVGQSITHFQLSATQSLLVRPDGEPLENNGQKPDYWVETSLHAPDKYAPMIELAAQLLTDRSAFLSRGDVGIGRDAGLKVAPTPSNCRATINQQIAKSEP